jgi:GNAT superfamily N-acetyltransferase
MDIIRITGELSADIATLAPFATVEGVGIIDALMSEWASDANRFSQPGETLLIARIDGRLTGTGGITRDYNFPKALRMRRFYVHPGYRSRGIARALAEQLIVDARHHTNWLTCHAGTEAGTRFWERMGFAPVTAETHTHELRLY